MSRLLVALLVAVVAVVVGAGAYAAGIAAGRDVPAGRTIPPAAQPAQAQNPVIPPEPFQMAPPGQSPPTLREFIPLPGPGDQQPGQRPDQQGGCEPIILFYHNGQLYQLRPGQGPQDGQGRPGAPPEFFYLNPYQGPPIPGLPQPGPERSPGFSPVNPRS